MSAISEISEKLKKYSNLNVDARDSSLTVHPQNESGFKVSIDEEADEYKISFGGGWHEHFKSKNEALNCFAFGLSKKCRLKITYRGKYPHRWTVQHFEAGKWIDESSTGLLFYPFWKTKDEKFFQNAIISD